MEIVAQPLDWTQIDEENLAKFLDTESGKRLLPKLLEVIPPLLARGDVNAILIRSGEVRGYQEIARTILALAHPVRDSQPESNQTAYPRLDDDKSWSDGQKLTPAQE